MGEALGSNNIIPCPAGCGAILDAGDEKRAVVVHCYRTGKSCGVGYGFMKQWGSPRTRVDCAADDDPTSQDIGKPKSTHVLQLDPPEVDDESGEFVLDFGAGDVSGEPAGAAGSTTD